MKSPLTGEQLSNVFSEFEPHLIPQTFNVDEELLNTIEKIHSIQLTSKKCLKTCKTGNS